MKISKNKLQVKTWGFTPTLTFFSFFSRAGKRVAQAKYIKNISSLLGIYIKNARAKRKLVSGFTLIEMMVTVGIIALFSAIVLVKHARFGEEIAINNLAHEMGLAIREAQVYGISVREGSSAFQSAYGVHFNINSPNQFLLFIDTNNSTEYDEGELVETYSVRGGNFIYDLCVVSPAENCDINTLDVTFLRPDPDATLITSPPLSADTALIKIRSPKGLERQVLVNITGQISVE